MKLQLKRSNVLVSGGAKEPTAAQLDYGELAINYSAGDAAIFLKDSTNNVIRIAGVHNIADDGLTNIPTTTSPPTTPTPEAGNLWYNSEDGRLYIYYVDDNSSQWVDASPDTWQTTIIPDITNPTHQTGTLDDRYIKTNAHTLTGALLLDNAATVATPDLAFDGDLNTGIYSPGADSLAITTAGTQRVTVDSSGNVGIGTSDPVRKLHIHEPSSNDNSYIHLTSATTGTAISDGLSIFQYGTGTRKDAVIALRENADLIFRTNNYDRLRIDSSGNCVLQYTGKYMLRENAVNAWSMYTDGANYPLIFKDEYNAAERLRIDSLGKIGIGTSSPAELLHVSGSGTQAIRLENTSSAPGNANLELKLTSNTFTIGLNSTSNIFKDTAGREYIWYQAGNERMRIDSSGNVGINNSSPSSYSYDGRNLVVGAGSGSQGLTIASGTTRYGTINFADGTSGDARYSGSILYNHANDFMRFDTAALERMRIDSSGNVGIGTSNPGVNLEIGGSASVKINLRSNNNSTGVSGLNFGDASSATTGGISYYHSADAMAFYVNVAKRMQIDAYGRIGIGTDIFNDIRERLRIQAPSGQAGTFLTIQAPSNTGESCLFFGDADDFNVGSICYKHSGNSMVFSTNDTERMRIDSSGHVFIAKSASNFADAGIELREYGEVVVTRSGGDVITTRRLVSEGTHFSLRNNSGVAVGTIVTTSSSTAYNHTSDYRLKENVVDIADGIIRVKQLSPRRFNFIADDTRTVDGFIAHEAQTVVPEAVTGEKDGQEMQGIDHSKLVPLLTAAIQEAIAKIETLEHRLSDAGIA